MENTHVLAIKNNMTQRYPDNKEEDVYIDNFAEDEEKDIESLQTNFLKHSRKRFLKRDSNKNCHC